MSSRPRPTGSNFELYAWFFMRISGVLLLFLAVGHLAIMHWINSVDDINYNFVAQRFALPFWRIYDILLLFLALVHGMNGFRIVIDDYVSRRGLRVGVLATGFTAAFILLVIGAMTILTFQPVAAAAAAR